MKSYAIAVALLVTVVALGVLLSSPLSQAADVTYDLTWWTVDGGGGISQDAGGVYTLDCTLGQPDVGYVLSGGAYSTIGGYWESGLRTGMELFLPLVLKGG